MDYITFLEHLQKWQIAFVKANQALCINADQSSVEIEAWKYKEKIDISVNCDDVQGMSNALLALSDMLLSACSNAA